MAALLEAVGPSGTLIAPTFNFGFTRGEPFDARATPSKMGAITELVRTDPRATRVAHPIYSFAVIGAYGIAGYVFHDAEAKDIFFDSAMASLLASGVITPKVASGSLSPVLMVMCALL